jgi:hypothetical protein
LQDTDDDDYEEEYEQGSGEASELVVVLGGTKGTAYHVALDMSDLLSATITPLDKVAGHPDNAKAIKVGRAAA